MQNPNYKSKNIERKYLKNMQKEPIFTGKEWSFRIRRRFYRVE